MTQSNPPEESSYPLPRKKWGKWVISVVGLLASIVGILAYFEIKPLAHNEIKAKELGTQNNTTSYNQTGGNTGQTFNNATSYNQSGGQTAGTINNGELSRTITEKQWQEFESNLKPFAHTFFIVRFNTADRESTDFGWTIISTLYSVGLNPSIAYDGSIGAQTPRGIQICTRDLTRPPPLFKALQSAIKGCDYKFTEIQDPTLEENVVLLRIGIKP